MIRCVTFRPVLAALVVLLAGCFRPTDGLPNLPDAGRDAGVVDGHDGAVEPVRHEACRMALDDAQRAGGFVADPFLVQQAAQNAFRERGCEELPALTRCADDHTCQDTDYCLRPVQGEPGFCMNGESTVQPQLLAFRDGLCRATWLQSLDKAALCCAKVEGVDCRPLPFVEPGGPGLFCTRTEDCEAGLVCREMVTDETAGESLVLGTCQCPEAQGTFLENPGFCVAEQELVPGLPAQPGETGQCQVALASGFVQEVISNAWPPVGLAGGYPQFVQRTPSGAPAFIDYRDRAYLIALAADVPEMPSLRKVSDFGFGYALYDLGLEGSVAAASFDTSGRLHVVREDGLTVALLVGGDGADFQELALPAPCGILQAFALDAEDHHHLACSRSPGVRYMREDDAGWTVREHDLGIYPDRIFFASDGRALTTARFSEASVVDLDTGSELTHDAAVVSDAVTVGDLLVLVESSDEGFHLLTSRSGAPFVHERFAPPSLLAVSASEPSLAVDASGRISIAHRSRAGIALTERTVADWTTELLTSDDAGPIAVAGPGAVVQVFYMVDTNWDFQTQADEFRRLRAGACAP